MRYKAFVRCLNQFYSAAIDRCPRVKRRQSHSCASPKFCPAVKSTACEISSVRSPAITLPHVPLVPALVRSTRSCLSFTPKPAPGEFGASAATHGTEAQATPNPNSARSTQTLLGARSPVLVCMEAVSHCRYPGDRGPLAPDRLLHVLELQLGLASFARDPQ